MEENEKITQIDIEEWPVTILILSTEHPGAVLHAVMYPKTPNDATLEALKAEFIEEFDYRDDPDELQYSEITTEEFMQMLGAVEVEDDD